MNSDTGGAWSRRLAMGFCELVGRPYEYLNLSKDTTESDLKQRREGALSLQFIGTDMSLLLPIISPFAWGYFLEIFFKQVEINMKQHIDQQILRFWEWSSLSLYTASFFCILFYLLPSLLQFYFHSFKSPSIASDQFAFLLLYLSTVIDGSVVFADSAPVRAALHGHVLVLLFNSRLVTFPSFSCLPPLFCIYSFHTT